MVLAILHLYASVLFCALFLSEGKVLKISAKFCVSFFLFHNIVAGVVVCLYSHVLMLSGGAEINPGPLGNCKEYFSIFHQNLNSISVHDYSKLFPLEAYIIRHKFGTICLSETYLDSNTPKLQISGCTLISPHRPSNSKLCGGYMNCKSSLPLRVINIGYLHECSSFELQIGNKIFNFVALYRLSVNLQTILKILLIILK